MKTKIPWLILVGVLVLLFVAGFMLMQRQVTVTVDGQTSIVHTRALTVGQALHGMGFDLTVDDQVDPPANTWLAYASSITLARARSITIWIDPVGTHVQVMSPAQTVREALTLIGVSPTKEDTVRLNGSLVGLDDPLPNSSLLLQYSPALPIQFTQNGKQQELRSSAGTLGAALWANGVTVRGSDQLSAPFDQPLTSGLSLNLAQGSSITISVDGKTIHSFSAAPTVGAALAENGISLQDLDYSQPAEDSSLPQDGKIQVVRVKLVILDQQEIVPYTTEYTTDSSLPAGEKDVTRAGQNGINDTRVIVRYENGTEVSRETETKLVIQEPINEQVTTGPQTSGQTTQTPASSLGTAGTISTEEGSLPYYLSVSVHATSYSPCRSGGSCSNLTASGQPVVKGVLGVTSAWYQIFHGYRIYIPGYGIGTVEDIGGGIAGENWIDLGYSDDDWVNWSKSVTVYFLSPAPDNFSGTLP